MWMSVWSARVAQHAWGMQVVVAVVLDRGWIDWLPDKPTAADLDLPCSRSLGLHPMQDARLDLSSNRIVEFGQQNCAILWKGLIKCWLLPREFSRVLGQSHASEKQAD